MNKEKYPEETKTLLFHPVGSEEYKKLEKKQEKKVVKKPELKEVEFY